jgi:HEAT repeat protein
LSWLKDPDAQVRKAAAFNLCWLPSADAVPNLLDAIHSETDRAVKAQLLVALAQTGDKRGLDTLLAAAREPYGPDDAEEIVSGLGRIRDPKALATLADMVEGKTRSSHAADDRAYLLPSAVNAFGYISQLYAAHVPDRFESSSGISDAQVRLDVERIEQWRKSQTDK